MDSASRRLAAIALVLFAALTSTAARAADALDRSIVVLPLDTSKTGGKVTLADRASLEEMLRDEAIDALQPLGWKVLSGENTIQLLQDNGIDPAACDEGSCHLTVARQMTVPLFVSGAIQFTSDGVYTASFRLYDTKSGDPLASKRVESPDLRGLREQFHKLAPDFFARAPAAKNSQDGVNNGSASEAHLGGQQQELNLGNHEVIVSFDSEPEGAVVLLDGAVLCQSTPCKKTLPLGGHTISLQKDGYETVESPLVVKKGTTVSQSLNRISARVAVETTPPGLHIRIDGKDAGSSPVAARDYSAGSHEFLVDDPCYVQEGERAILKKGEDRTLHFSPKPKLAGLTVSAEDARGNAVEARVLVDGVEVGSTPGSYKVGICSKRVELRAGDLGATQDLSLGEGKVQTLHARLTQQTGVLRITVSRSADCKIGDRSFSVSVSGEESIRLPVGAAQVTCSADNPDGSKASGSSYASVGADGSSTRVELGAEPPAGPGFWTERKTIRYGFTAGTGGVGFINDGKFVAQTGWNWQAQAELGILEFFFAQLGGNICSLNDSSGNSEFVWGGTGAAGLRPLRDFFQPWVAIRYSSWGSTAGGGSLEGGIRLAGENFGVDFSADYGLAGPAQWVATISFVWMSSR